MLGLNVIPYLITFTNCGRRFTVLYFSVVEDKWLSQCDLTFGGILQMLSEGKAFSYKREIPSMESPVAEYSGDFPNTSIRSF